jgi:hypothetical protein
MNEFYRPQEDLGRFGDFPLLLGISELGHSAIHDQ